MSEKAGIQAVIFDWAGTMVDFGCMAPVKALTGVFKEANIELSVSAARQYMGLPKKVHIGKTLEIPEVAALWRKRYGREADESDVDQLYSRFETDIVQYLEKYAEPVPGILRLIGRLRSKGIAIGSTTGYTKEMAGIVRSRAKELGLEVDCCVTPEDVGAGRPFPWMCQLSARKLEVYPPHAIIKVGDTVSDMQEGKNAGMWSVGIVRGGNELGLSEEEIETMPQDEYAARFAAVRKKLLAAGADYVISSIADLEDVISSIHTKQDIGNGDSTNQQLAGEPYLLFTPGPLTTSMPVKEAMLRDWCTWDNEYNTMVQQIRRKLVSLGLRNEASASGFTSVLMQGSGTFAVEAVLGTVIPEEGKLLILSNGAYGKRMAEIAEILGIHYVLLNSEETSIPDLEALEQLLGSDPDISHVAAVHCETTSGILNPIEKIAGIVKQRGKTLIVDAMSSFGGIELYVDELGIDFLISSANKCIQGVPGFGFVIASAEKLKQCKGRARSHSLNLYDQWREMEEHSGKWRFTSPTHVVHAFHKALEELDREGGIAARSRRYSGNQRLLAKGMGEIGFKTFIEEEYQSPFITSFYYPESTFDFNGFYSELKKAGFVIYPGKITKANTFRIGSMGEIYEADILRLLDAAGRISGQLQQEAAI